MKKLLVGFIILFSFSSFAVVQVESIDTSVPTLTVHSDTSIEECTEKLNSLIRQLETKSEILEKVECQKVGKKAKNSNGIGYLWNKATKPGYKGMFIFY